MLEDIKTVLSIVKVPIGRITLRSVDQAIMWDHYALYRVRPEIEWGAHAAKTLYMLLDINFVKKDQLVPGAQKAVKWMNELMGALSEAGLDRDRIKLRQHDGAYLYKGAVIGGGFVYYNHKIEEEGLQAAVDEFISTIPVALLKEEQPSTKKVLAFIDFETNGLRDCSVLSASAIKVIFDNGRFLFGGDFNRFYYAREQMNPRAMEVHHLTKEGIQERRNPEWYTYFDEDEDFKIFLSDADVVVSHNVKFDSSFIWFDVPGTFFCTMEVNTAILKLQRSNGKLKFPSLQETAVAYRIDVDASQKHESKYDAYLCFLIFKRMFEEFNQETLEILGV